jgi:hypothetical protein
MLKSLEIHQMNKKASSFDGRQYLFIPGPDDDCDDINAKQCYKKYLKEYIFPALKEAEIPYKSYTDITPGPRFSQLRDLIDRCSQMLIIKSKAVCTNSYKQAFQSQFRKRDPIVITPPQEVRNGVNLDWMGMDSLHSFSCEGKEGIVSAMAFIKDLFMILEGKFESDLHVPTLDEKKLSPSASAPGAMMVIPQIYSDIANPADDVSTDRSSVYTGTTNIS